MDYDDLFMLAMMGVIFITSMMVVHTMLKLLSA
jgi:hypothetical protein